MLIFNLSIVIDVNINISPILILLLPISISYLQKKYSKDTKDKIVEHNNIIDDKTKTLTSNPLRKIKLFQLKDQTDSNLM